MIREFLSTTELAIFPLMAFVLFFFTFVAVCAVTIISAVRKDRLDHMASLPLEDDDVETEGERS